jgi:hypothetical protein
MIEIDAKSINDWKNRKSGELFIAEQLFHRHADLFLNNYYSTRNEIEKALIQTINNIEFKISENKKKKGQFFKRLSAKPLKSAIKNNITNIPGIKNDVEYTEGVFFESLGKTQGFDFAIIDDEYNITNFRNHCFGYKAIATGIEEWEKVLEQRPSWKHIANDLFLPSLDHNGSDLYSHKNLPTIIGGIQFGNWGLVHTDMLNAIYIEQQTEVDLLVYITATGNLEQYLSEGIVNFQDTKQMLEKFNNIIKIPIWLIGIDIK